MPSLSRAEKHIAKQRQYLQEAEDAWREALQFGITGEPDENGNHPGNSKEAQRMIDLSRRLVEKSERHAAKAQRHLEGI